jgi:hypothetical protein
VGPPTPPEGKGLRKRAGKSLVQESLLCLCGYVEARTRPVLGMRQHSETQVSLPDGSCVEMDLASFTSVSVHITVYTLGNKCQHY